MTQERIRSGLRELADAARPAYDLADVAIRRADRARWLVRGGAIGGGVLAVTGAVGLVAAAPWSGGPAGDQAMIEPSGSSGDTSPQDREEVLEPRIEVSTPEDDADPPSAGVEFDPIPERADRVAALQVAGQRTGFGQWYVVEPETGQLVERDWTWVTASPDGERLAVIERQLADRIGIVDRASGEVERWIDVPAGVSRLFWSPTDDRIVATLYEQESDRAMAEYGPRTGFVLVDVGDDAADDTVSEVIELPDDGMEPADYGWNDAVFWTGDGSGLVSPYAEEDGWGPLGVHFLSVDGAVERSLPNIGQLAPADGIATSPDNAYIVAVSGKTKSRVLDAATGDLVEETRTFGVTAWLDEERLIGNLAWDEITAELAVIGVDGTVHNELWKAPTGEAVDAMAIGS